MKETNSRFEQRAKRRKANRILNIALAFVLSLIAFFSWKLFFTADQSKQATERKTNINETKKTDSDKVEVEIGETEKTNNEETAPTTEKAEVIETAGDPASGVEKEIVDPSWQPIGTTQSEPHVTTFDENSVDWKEMLDAVSYATGLAHDNMIVWFIGNNGPNKAVATVSPNDKSVKYKVYIAWVEHQGWKPEKIEQLTK
ncbi:MAG: YrrS family protein [Anoxybacillus sp.]|nr:YrrS family protein [Anoxybacillus sp.]MCL6588070.1 YrrS family protein [Anoxybacillus sp.]